MEEPNAFDIREVLRERSKGAQRPVPCHWIHGVGEVKGERWDAGTNFCRPCCEKEIDRINAAHPCGDGYGHPKVSLDGVGVTDHDSTPYCEVCGALLDGTLTEYGAQEELEHFKRHPPSTPEEYADLLRALENCADSDPAWSTARGLLNMEVT